MIGDRTFRNLWTGATRPGPPFDRRPGGTHYPGMAILKIARMGHPLLMRRADPVADPRAPEVARVVRDMFETLADLSGGGVGLAAPQVHLPLRIVVFAMPEDEAGPDGVPPPVLVNPEIEPVGDRTETDWEGCLSLPDLRGMVPRHARIRYWGVTPEGETVEREAEGFHARLVQHECDHLDGVLYPMRMTDLSTLQYVSEAARAPREGRAA